MRLRHHGCGQHTTAEVTCAHFGQPLTIEDVTMKAAPTDALAPAPSRSPDASTARTTAPSAHGPGPPPMDAQVAPSVAPGTRHGAAGAAEQEGS
jgi:hypothetical protein